MKINLKVSNDLKNIVQQFFKQHKVFVITGFVFAIIEVIFCVIRHQNYGFTSWISPEKYYDFLQDARIDTAVTGFGIFLCTAILFCETIFKNNNKRRFCGYIAGTIMALVFVFFTDIYSLELIWEENEKIIFIAKIFEYISFIYVLILVLSAVCFKIKHCVKE